MQKSMTEQALPLFMSSKKSMTSISKKKAPKHNRVGSKVNIEKLMKSSNESSDIKQQDL